jgi:hypothetical protein
VRPAPRMHVTLHRVHSYPRPPPATHAATQLCMLWYCRSNTKFDVREYYDAGGELKASKKGAALGSDMLQTLSDKLQEINTLVDRLAPGGAGAGSSKAGSKAGAAAKPQQAVAPAQAASGEAAEQCSTAYADMHHAACCRVVHHCCAL